MLRYAIVMSKKWFTKEMQEIEMELCMKLSSVLALAYFVDRTGKFLINSRSLSNVDNFG